VNGAVRGALAGVSLETLASTPVRPEPVEGLSFLSSTAAEGQGFDRLSPNGADVQSMKI
jgi:hypothetical protein